MRPEMTDIYPNPKPPTEHRLLRTGDKLRYGDGKVYILACVDIRTVAAVSLYDGNRWTSGVQVDDLYALTADDMERILAADFRDDWTVEELFTHDHKR